MKNRPLWPLLPLVVVPGMMLLFLSVTAKSQGPATDCAVQKLIGLHCPGCGGTRCAQSIASGRWIAAMGHNAMLMTGFLVLMTSLVFIFVRMTLLGKPAPQLPHISPRWVWCGIGAIAIFTILRNIPTYPFTLLAP